MARRAKPAAAHTAWLPGFEPAGFESALLNIPRSLENHPFVVPPSLPSAVAVASAVVAQHHIAPPRSTKNASAGKPFPQVIGAATLPQPESNIPVVLAPQEESVVDAIERNWPDFDAARHTPATVSSERFEGNIKAIRLAKELSAQGLAPTNEQRHDMLRYVGWGGMANVFETLPNHKKGAEQALLKAMLTDDEFASARASTPTAFYTDPLVIKAIWSLVQRLGFQGGRIIEPASGTGLFLAGMPKEIAVKSEITAVELDKVSGQILNTVFGDLGVHTHITAIEKANVPHGFYDLAIGNVPFGDFKSLETRKVGYGRWNIHNYFFGKAVDLVRPGGLIAFITSTGTLDSLTENHRVWLEAHAELLGAIRLPAKAFKRQAGTDVVADIIVLKKRPAPVFNDTGEWIKQIKAPEAMLATGKYETYYCSHSRKQVPYRSEINAWFGKHPGMVVGELHQETGQYGRSILTPKFKGTDEELATALASVITGLAPDVYKAASATNEAGVAGGKSLLLDRMSALSAEKPGSFVVRDGNIYISEGANWIDVDSAYKGMTRERILGLVKIRDAARKLLTTQVESDDDSLFKSEQYVLNTVYDAFVAEYGNVQDNANVRVFRGDPECPLVLSLEKYNEDDERFERADIFTKRTAGRKPMPETADTVKDAMLISLALHGRIALGDMKKRMRRSKADIEGGLRDEALAYIDPEDGLWKPSDEYLSGHIRDKIAAAQAAGSRFERNVEALTAVLPKDLGPGEVEVRLGAPWVPSQLVEAFAAELIEAKPGEITVDYDTQSACWSIKAGHSIEYAGNRMLNTATWGTNKRCAVVLIEGALNQVPPTITFTDSLGKAIPDRPGTLAAREKYEAIKAEFKKWAYADDARRDMLLRIYNDQFNQIVERQYDGSHLVLPGMSCVIVPYKSQLDAIWRIVSGGNTLLAHTVGAGKTFIMAAAAMELRRIGRANKPCVAVPNHMLEQFTGDVVRFYPNAKVLMASKEELSGDRRREFCARIATGDWDLVVMTHGTFETMPMRPETVKRFVDEITAQARLAKAQADGQRSKRTVKQLEKMIKSIESRVERQLNAQDKDDFMYFDDLGIDWQMIDEAHLFKNLMRITKMPNIAGLPNVSSNRAFDLWVKSSMLMEKRGGKQDGVTLATATPISNSVAEMHVFQRYLQPETLKRMGLYEFDAWAASFGEAVQGMEVAPDGSGYRLNTRFAKFVNVSDLMAIFRQVADIRTRSMLNLPTPDVKGGKPQTVLSPKGAELQKYTQSLVERADAIRARKVKPSEDNMLAITNCGRKAALDMRLIDPSLPFDPNGKVAKVCEDTYRTWKETAHLKGTQLIFCDLSTPTSTGFSVYNDVRDRLVDMGIPRAEIAFIHEYKTDKAKARLFRMVRAGLIRVLMGSTTMMGVGTNVQRLLKAIRQLDVPWRPSDVEQRDGRGLRAGNLWDEIELVRYCSEGSFDAYSWQTLEIKARFIEQLMTCTSGIRTVEDLTMGALTYAEIKAIASGNPLVLEKATVDAEVMKLAVLKDQWLQDRWTWGRRAKSNAEDICAMTKAMAGVEQDAAALEDEARRGWTFKPRGPLSDAVTTGEPIHMQIGAHLVRTYRGLAEEQCGEFVVGSVAGLKIILTRYNHTNIIVQGRSRSYTLDRTGSNIQSAEQTGRKVMESLELLLQESGRLIQQVQRKERENRDIEQRLALDFEHEELLQAQLRRQREIEVMLDLDKSEAGAEVATAPEQATDAA